MFRRRKPPDRRSMKVDFGHYPPKKPLAMRVAPAHSMNRDNQRSLFSLKKAEPAQTNRVKRTVVTNTENRECNFVTQRKLFGMAISIAKCRLD